ncbi:hypothetical protein [Niveispirillum sp. KHB5.9]|uniref:hypothetical protein n=1 Tax=Niveispirillum sp. KHB5.9 TaxID=3400269 RepID=UPI003A88D78E
MIQIGPGPMDALRDALCRTFRQRLLDQFVHLHGPAIGERGLAERIDVIRAAEDMAGRYRLDDEHSVATLANLLFLYGPDLDARADLPWIRRILQQRQVPAPVRATQLERMCRIRLAGAPP